MVAKRLELNPTEDNRRKYKTETNIMGIYKKSDDYYIDYYVDGRRKREKIGPSYKAAQNALRKRRVQVAENRWIEKKPVPQITLGDLAGLYLKACTSLNRPNTCDSKKYYWQSVQGFFGDGRRAATITRRDVERFIEKRLKEVKPSSVNRERDFLSGMFSWAIENGKLEENPIRQVRKLKENNERVRFLAPEELQRLLTACRGYLLDIVTLGINTGMRKSEILKLEWQQIDFHSGLITIPESKAKGGEKRHLPMNPLVLEVLNRRPRRIDSSYVIPNKRGRPFRDVKKGWKAALRKANIENFRFHDLRHCLASYAAMAGESLEKIRAILGHKDSRVTRRYAHLSPESLRSITEKVASRILDGHQDGHQAPKTRSGGD